MDPLGHLLCRCEVIPPLIFIYPHMYNARCHARCKKCSPILAICELPVDRTCHNLAGNVYRNVRGETRERASTHLKLATLTSLAMVLATVLAVAIVSVTNEPDEKQFGRVIFSPSTPTPAPQELAPTETISEDHSLTEVAAASHTPNPTPTAQPATPTAQASVPAPQPVAPAPPAAPAAAPIPAVPPPTPAPTPTPPPGSLVTGLAGQLLQMINAERASAGVPQLTVHASLVATAEDYAALHFLHADPFQLSHDLDGPLLDRFGKKGYTGGGGEALVAGPPDAQILMDTWMNSPAHRALLLDPQYIHFGVGCYQGPYTNSQGYTFDAIALCVADLGFPA